MDVGQVTTVPYITLEAQLPTPPPLGEIHSPHQNLWPYTDQEGSHQPWASIWL